MGALASWLKSNKWREVGLEHLSIFFYKQNGDAKMKVIHETSLSL